MRTSILLFCSLVLGSACGQAGASSVGLVPAQSAASVPAVEAQLTLDVLELI